MNVPTIPTTSACFVSKAESATTESITSASCDSRHLIDPVYVQIENAPEAFSDVEERNSKSATSLNRHHKSTVGLANGLKEDRHTRATAGRMIDMISQDLSGSSLTEDDSLGSKVSQISALSVKSPERRLSSPSPPKALQRRASNDALKVADIRTQLPVRRDGAPKSAPSAREVRVLARDLLPKMPSRSISPTRSCYNLPPRAPSRARSSRELSMQANPRRPADNPEPRQVVKQRHVTFSTVQIRYYERVLDMHPCTSSGPSVGIGWCYMEEEDVIDVYAMERILSSQQRGDPRAFVLPRHVRESLLRDSGYTDRDIAKSVRQSQKAKHQRRQTIQNRHAEKVEYMVEKSRRTVGRLLRFKGFEAA